MVVYLKDRKCTTIQFNFFFNADSSRIVIKIEVTTTLKVERKSLKRFCSRLH